MWEEWGVNGFDKRNVCTGQRGMGKAVNAHGQSASAAAATATTAQDMGSHN